MSNNRVRLRIAEGSVLPEALENYLQNALGTYETIAYGQTSEVEQHYQERADSLLKAFDFILLAYPANSSSFCLPQDDLIDFAIMYASEYKNAEDPKAALTVLTNNLINLLATHWDWPHEQSSIAWATECLDKAEKYLISAEEIEDIATVLQTRIGDKSYYVLQWSHRPSSLNQQILADFDCIARKPSEQSPLWFKILPHYEQSFLKTLLASGNYQPHYRPNSLRGLPGPANSREEKTALFNDQGQLLQDWKPVSTSAHLASQDALKSPEASRFHAQFNLNFLFGSSSESKPSLLQTLVSDLDWVSRSVASLKGKTPPDSALHQLLASHVKDHPHLFLTNRAVNRYETVEAYLVDQSALYQSLIKFLDEKTLGDPKIRPLFDIYKSELDAREHNILLSTWEHHLFRLFEDRLHITCVGGKDRTAVLLMLILTMAIYQYHYQQWPDAEEALAQPFSQLAADIFMSGHHQAVAAQNAKGCQGIQYADTYLPPPIRDAISKKEPAMLATGSELASMNEVEKLGPFAVDKEAIQTRITTVINAHVKKLTSADCQAIIDALGRLFSNIRNAEGTLGQIKSMVSSLFFFKPVATTPSAHATGVGQMKKAIHRVDPERPQLSEVKKIELVKELCKIALESLMRPGTSRDSFTSNLYAVFSRFWRETPSTAWVTEITTAIAQLIPPSPKSPIPHSYSSPNLNHTTEEEEIRAHSPGG